MKVKLLKTWNRRGIKVGNVYPVVRGPDDQGAVWIENERGSFFKVGKGEFRTHKDVRRELPCDR